MGPQPVSKTWSPCQKGSCRVLLGRALAPLALSALLAEPIRDRRTESDLTIPKTLEIEILTDTTGWINFAPNPETKFQVLQHLVQSVALIVVKVLAQVQTRL